MKALFRHLATVIVAVGCYAVAQAGILPRGFVQNQGQWENRVLWVAANNSSQVAINSQGIDFDFYQTVQQNVSGKTITSRQGQNVRMSLEGSSFSGLAVYGEGEPVSRFSYFKGNNESKWVAGLEVYNSLMIQDVYPGVSMRLLLDDGNARYDFIVAPGAAPSAISLKFEGANYVHVENGVVELHTIFGVVKNGNLRAYQEISGKRIPVACDFRRQGDRISFSVGEYNRSIPLIIDPTVYATYLGTSGSDEITDMIRDVVGGDILVVGNTDSPNFPTTTGVYQKDFAGLSDIFVARFNEQLTTLKSATFVGGGGSDKAVALATDPNGNLYFTGETSSSDFPIKSNWRPNALGSVDAFAAKLSPIGDKLLYSTYIGGSGDDRGLCIAVDNSGKAAIGGETTSANFSTAEPLLGVRQALVDGFILKLNIDGSGADFATYWGGNGDDRVNAVAIDGNGSTVYFAGECSETMNNALIYPYVAGGGPPNPNPYDRTHNGLTDAFVARVSTNGRFQNMSIHFGTYLGGNREDRIKKIVVLSNGDIVVGGESKGNMPTSFANHKGDWDVFLAKFSSNGRNLLAGSYLGGSAAESLGGFFLSQSTGSLWVCGATSSTNFPANPSYRPEQTKLGGGGFDGFLARVDPASFGETYATYIGGVDYDECKGVACTDRGDPYIAGSTKSMGGFLPTFYDSYARTNAGGQRDGFLRKIAFGRLLLSSPNSGVFCPGLPLPIQWAREDMVPDDPITVQYSADNGITWTDAVTGIRTDSYDWQVPSGLAPGKNYRIRVLHASGLRYQSDSALTLIAAPVIAEQPKSDTVCPGTNVTFSLVAEGDQLTYSWKNGNQEIPGANKPTYTISNVKPTDAGRYTVIISSGCSPITSQAAVLVVKPTTVITEEPKNIEVDAGKSAVLTVKANGSKLSYQWQFGTANITNANAPTYTIPSANQSNEGKYRVIATGECGSDTSVFADVKVNPPSSVEANEVVNANLVLALLTSMPATDAATATVVAHARCHAVIRLTDMFGQTIQTVFNGMLEPLSVVPMSFSVKNLPTGTYYLNARCGGEATTQKIQVVR